MTIFIPKLAIYIILSVLAICLCGLLIGLMIYFGMLVWMAIIDWWLRIKGLSKDFRKFRIETHKRPVKE